MGVGSIQFISSSLLLFLYIELGKIFMIQGSIYELSDFLKICFVLPVTHIIINDI